MESNAEFRIATKKLLSFITDINIFFMKVQVTFFG